MSNNNGLIDKIRKFFIHDDGSLPDIFIYNLNEESIRKAYLEIISLGVKKNKIEAWDVIKNQKNCYSYSDYIDGVFSGTVETTRIALPHLCIRGLLVPISTTAIYSNEQIEFDYRMGPHWSDDCITALLEFIALLKDKNPELEVKRACEGHVSSPDLVFTSVFLEYYNLTRARKNNATL